MKKCRDREVAGKVQNREIGTWVCSQDSNSTRCLNDHVKNKEERLEIWEKERK